MGHKYEKEIKKHLKENGCYFVRQSIGDHEIWFSPITNRIVTVDTGTKNRYLANRIMSQAGIAHRF